ncbi:MAG TPA: replication protein RepA [Rhodocyclaceae bacterium]|nr:replication protein RepA [Rhodocyclaceae bacterium]
MSDNSNDEITYRDLLIQNGLDPALAAQIASKTEPASRRHAIAAAVQHGANNDSAAAAAAPVDESAEPAEVPPAAKRPASPRKKAPETVDFRSSKPIPAWIQEVINTHLAIEAEDAKKAGALGFMARALVIATMPYKDQKNPDGSPKIDFTRRNGDFKLRIVAGYEGGIPYGVYPRLLMSWVASEAVRKQSPVIELGDSLRGFLREVMDLRSASGGTRGTATRVSEQMKRLFGSLITAQYSGSQEKRGFVLKNVLIADELELHDEEMAADDDNALWTPQAKHEAGTWQSKVKLTNNFFQECITNPVPIDLRAYKALRGSPLAMDIYTWLTYRMSYVQSRTRPITWEALMLQFGSGFGATAATQTSIKQAVWDFKKGFLKALKLVQVVYPEAKFDVTDTGLVLFPSPTHVPSLGKSSGQQDLF